VSPLFRTSRAFLCFDFFQESLLHLRPLLALVLSLTYSPFPGASILLEGLEPRSRTCHWCGNFLGQPLCWTGPRTYCRWLRCRNHRLEMDNLDSHDLHRFRLDPAMVCARDLCRLSSLPEGQTPRKSRRKRRPTQIPSTPCDLGNRSKTPTSYILLHISNANH